MRLRMALAGITVVAAFGCLQHRPDVPAISRGTADYHPSRPMVGTIEERNNAIAAALDSDDERIAQLNLQDRSLEIALHFLANHARADMRIDWAGLERAGISRDHATSTINLFNGTLREAFLALLWQQRLNQGGIRFWVGDGRINIAPSAAAADLLDSDASRKVNAQIRTKLAQPLDLGERHGTTDTLENIIYILSFSKKISLIVDWPELEHAGIPRTAPFRFPPQTFTGEATLRDLLNQMTLLNATTPLNYDIRAGMVRITTQARLDRIQKSGAHLPLRNEAR